MTNRASCSKKGLLVTKTLNGIHGVQVRTSKFDRTTYHGTTAAGVNVNSPAIRTLQGADDLIFERSNGSSTVIGKNDFEIAAVGFLSDFGYNVKMPRSS